MTKGRNTKLGYCDTVDGTYTLLGKVNRVTPPRTSVEIIDCTHMDSADDFKEKEPGWRDAGDIDVEVQFDKTETAAVYALEGVTKFWKITFSDGSAWVAKGFISDFGNETDIKDKVLLWFKVTVSGKPTFTPAA